VVCWQRREAIGAAKEIAGDGFVLVASAVIVRQALSLGLVDELRVSQIPVLFGIGIPAASASSSAASS
jgi:dihydrofolate reductase